MQTFQADNGEILHQTDTLYDEYEEETPERKTRPHTVEERQARKARRARSDTIIIPAQEEGFRRVFLGEDRWYAIRVGAAMKERIKFIAAYQTRPLSAVTHIAEVKEIRPYQDTGKYEIVFKGPAEEISHIPLGEPRNSPQGPVYTTKTELLNSIKLEDALA